MASPNSVRIRLRYPDVDTFVEKFAPNVTRGGIFLASRNIQAVDASIHFEIQLTGGQVVLAGQGRVTWVKEFNPAEPTRPYGMGVQFVSVEPGTKPILARILRAKEAAAGRRASGAFEPLASSGGSGATVTSAHAGNLSSASNGKSAVPPIDTSVDLAAEYGLSDTAVRRMIDRSWRVGARGDDLADLLKPDAPEPATLAQALAELPRLLDPQYSRRRATGTYRAAELAAATASAMASATVGRSAAVSTPPMVIISSPPPDSGPNPTPAPAAFDATENTDMTGERDSSGSIDVVIDDLAPAVGSNGEREHKRR